MRSDCMLHPTSDVCFHGNGSHGVFSFIRLEWLHPSNSPRHFLHPHATHILLLANFEWKSNVIAAKSVRRRIHSFKGTQILCQRSNLIGMEQKKEEKNKRHTAKHWRFSIIQHWWSHMGANEHCECCAQSQCNSDSVDVNAAKPHVKTRSLRYFSYTLKTNQKHSRT